MLRSPNKILLVNLTYFHILRKKLKTFTNLNLERCKRIHEPVLTFLMKVKIKVGQRLSKSNGQDVCY